MPERLVARFAERVRRLMSSRQRLKQEPVENPYKTTRSYHQ
ncbi:MAG: hypothetical protein R2912_04340 [Eubacteriales bacterium]